MSEIKLVTVAEKDSEDPTEIFSASKENLDMKTLENLSPPRIETANQSPKSA